MRGVGGTPAGCWVLCSCWFRAASIPPAPHLLVFWVLFPLREEGKLLKITTSCFCWKNTTATWERNREMQCMDSLSSAVGSQSIADHAKKANSDLPGQRARKMHVCAFSLRLASTAVLFLVCGEGQMGAMAVRQPSQELFAGIKLKHLWNRHWPVAGPCRIVPFLFEAVCV